ncbi:adenylate/guanylate cyclase domain-containing protein [Lunatibacter salilacus]|uniref:adenylate/guanylate cyclase domain-containing protein n=1 Tax=Lunatibacter salilacus TaxID=2483804 RepID=UPI00131BB4DE|nr:adenylate/guanylate cyclase domain-containing protein [Lunatibacter salilacus]
MLHKCKALLSGMGFFCLLVESTFGQDQKIADSLAIVYEQKNLDDTLQLVLLRNLAFNEVKNLQKAVEYADELIRLSQEHDNLFLLSGGYLQKGNKKRLLGELEAAMEAFFKSADAARLASFSEGEGAALGAIADIYSISGNHVNAMSYYHKAIEILRPSKDSIALASALMNAGDEFLHRENFDSALVYFEESGLIFEKVNYPIGKAYNLGNIGMVYANIGNSDLAESNINEAIRILEELQDYYPISVYLTYMADIYMEKGDQSTALNYAQRSLDLGRIHGLKEQIRDANLKLSEIHELSGNIDESFKYYKGHIAYRDSVTNVATVQSMADLRTNFEVSQKQIEVDLLNQQKSNQRIVVISLIIILFLGAIILVILYRYYKKIEKEERRSETLLLNILPAQTARELKLNGKVDAVKYDTVTVLFSDFVEFSKQSELMEPEKLVRSIDFYFKGFDNIISKYGLEKIKTMGDSYMCASGLPIPSKDHALQMVRAAKEMIDFVEEVKNLENDLPHFEMRVGIHTGPVVAGIVGIKKWQFDIWGNTVNIASRMESSSIPGRINLSETTYKEIKAQYACEYRGVIQVKNGGEFNMYFLS